MRPGAARSAMTAVGASQNAPKAVAAESVSATIVSVQCVKTTYGLTNDHVYLTFGSGGRVPGQKGHSIDTGEVWSPNYTIKGRGSVQVMLMQYSILTASFEIGAITINTGDTPGRFTKTLDGDGGRYVVTYYIKE